MLRLAAAIMISVSGCSLGMKSLPHDYDPRTIPECETDEITPLTDALGAAAFTALGIAIAVAGHDAADGSSKWAGVGLSGVVALGLGVSSAAGFGWVSECVAAKKQWNERQIEQDELVQEHKDERDAAEERGVESYRAASKPAARGFYCASSVSAAAAGLCAREKAACTQARDAALAVIADITNCVLVETAHCFDARPGDLRCSPSAESCAAQRERGGVPGECREEQ